MVFFLFDGHIIFIFFPKNSWSRSGQESSRSSKIQSQDIIDELYALNGQRYKKQ